MNDKYIIKVVGVQNVDGESDSIEVITTGDYRLSGSSAVITYNEYDEEDPNKSTLTTVTLDKGVLIIERQGDMSSRLILEKGRRHSCLYETAVGSMMIGIFTDSIRAELGENGGSVCASYQLDFNNSAVSYNEFNITVKEKES